MRVLSAILIVGACGGSSTNKDTRQEVSSPLGVTPGHAVYHTTNCTPDSDQGRLITFAPGTGGTPDGSRLFIQHLGDQTGLCVIGVPYENSQLAAACCTTTSTPDGPQDPDCLVRLLNVKGASNPDNMTCTDGSLLSVPRARSVEGAILDALQHIGMSLYLTDTGDDVLWNRVVLTGHSQGAQISLFIALTRHTVAGVGSIGGGVLKILAGCGKIDGEPRLSG